MSISKPKHIPEKPGIYIFKKGGVPIYVGKATNLKKRITSYFRKKVGDKIRHLTNEADSLEKIETASEVEALIKESELIKTQVPKFNVIMRDDKNYFYVGVTEENFPRIFVTHQPLQQTPNRKSQIARGYRKKTLATSDLPKTIFVGPFTSGTALTETLRLLRKIFPYCTCKRPHKRPCINSDIGRCPGVCCTPLAKFQDYDESARQYRKNIQAVVSVLKGKRKYVLKTMVRAMKKAAGEENFETASKLRDEIRGLENIFSHSHLINPKVVDRKLNWPKIRKNLKNLLGTWVNRAEGYDISNISGTETTGSMVVFTNGKPNKQEYRKFAIKSVSGPDDITSHKEVVGRRLRHTEWKYPELILIDGGIAQRNAALLTLRKSGIKTIAIAALAKGDDRLYTEGRNKPIYLSRLPDETAFFLRHIRDEAHRFAKKYHHKRRELLFKDEIQSQKN